MRLQLIISLIAVTLCVANAAPQWLTNTFISLVRENVAGTPLVHDRQVWHFHPDEGLIRRDRYQRLHGPRGEWLIKALGEGEGGFPKLGTEEGAPFKDNNKRRAVAYHPQINYNNAQNNNNLQNNNNPQINNNSQNNYNPQINNNPQINYNHQNNFNPQITHNRHNNNNPQIHYNSHNSNTPQITYRQN